MRALARNAALLLFGAVGAYLLSAVIAARLALLLVDAGGSSVWLRVLFGVIALDLSKLPGLLLAAWLLAATTKLRPMPSAVALVALTFALEIIIALLLGQHRWLWASAMVLLCRAAAASLLVYAVARLVRWRSVREQSLASRPRDNNRHGEERPIQNRHGAERPIENDDASVDRGGP
jgi:hypothetical protein